MKKIISLIITILILIIFLTGCTDEEERDNNDRDGEEDEISSYKDFIGTWETITGGGSFSEGNSIRFNNDFTYEKFWSHGGSAYHTGTWDLKDIIGEKPKIVMTQEGMSYSYTYTFYYGHSELELVPEGSTSGIYYVKQ